MIAGPAAAAFEALVSDLAIPRVGEPDEITRLVLFVASDEASFSTGSELIADGGLLLARCRTPARKGQMADHEVLIQQLNRHHATKQFDLLRKIAKEGKSYEPFQQPDSNREPKPRLQSVPNGFSDVQIFDPAQLFTSNPHPTLAMNQLPNSRVIWHERCLKDSEFESASKQMNTSQKRIPIFEFGEVKLEPAILRSKTSLKPTTRQRSQNSHSRRKQ